MTYLRKTLNIVAWIVLVLSLLQPMERHTVPGPCSWPCIYPFMFTVLDNTPIFILSPLFIPIYLLSDLKTAVAFVLYSFIGMGEIMVFLTPFFDGKLSKNASKYVFTLSLFSVLAILSYALFPALQYGTGDLMIGYYGLALSFLLMLASASIRMASENKKDLS